jgi:uncharacterized protein
MRSIRTPWRTRALPTALLSALLLAACGDRELLTPSAAGGPLLSSAASSGGVVISQVYGGGGNSGATLTHDFIELYNAGSAPVALASWSVQYASATGSSWQTTALSGSIAPGGYYLVQQAAGAGGTTPLPTPDATGSIAMSATAGKVALVNGTTALSGACPTGGGIADFVGFGSTANCFEGTGPTPAPSNTTAVLRKDGGAQDTGSNATDFEAGAPNPRNSGVFHPSAGRLVISQVYGGGGNSGATWTHDFIEVFNAGTTSASLAGLSVQYASASGTTWQVTQLSGSLQPGGYYLVQQAAGAGGTQPLPTPDATGSIAMGATAGKVALVNGITALSGSCPLGATVLDFVGYGSTANCSEGDAPTPNLNNITAALRKGEGCTDTTNNNADFVVGAPAPRNTATTARPCTPSEDPPGGEIGTCEQPFTAAYTIQGRGMESPIDGQVVNTQGVVVGDFQGAAPALGGFYLQDATGDGDPETSDAVFVFNRGLVNVQLGDVVRVRGTVQEFQDQTQIGFVDAHITCGTGASIQPTDVTLPFPSPTYLERYEGMLVRLPQTLTVTEHFQLGRFGQVVMSSGGRLRQPTQVAMPGTAALAVQAQNDLNRIMVDDELNNQNGDPIVFGRGGDPLTASNTLRGGDQATGIVGVLTYTWAGNAASGNAYRLRPVNAMGGGVPSFQATNPRPSSPPSVGSGLKVAAFNLLNYFNTFTGCSNGLGGTPSNSNCRGADNAAEFERQWPKTVAAILAMEVDVLGVVEIENDGYGPESAIAHLVGKLNDAAGAGTYALIDADAATGQIDVAGTDGIKNAIIYKPARVTPVGQTAVLNSVTFVNGGDTAPRNRPSVVQAFQQHNGGRFLISVNHFKSKGSACNAPDAGDGQGNCNAVRVSAANRLLEWLATDPTGTGETDVLIVGDLNSYAMEDPITLLKNGGFTDLGGPNTYSYAFDGQWGTLDYALASASLMPQLTGAAKWHINADEPNVLDYNTNFKSPGQQSSLYAADQFRVSDHDPILVGMNLLAYAFGGFLAPVATPPSGNRTNAGQNIPVKFSLGGNFGLNIFQNGFPASRPVSCTTWQPTGGLATIGSPGGSGLSYDASTGAYNVGWQTDRAWGGTCRELVVRFNDGSTHTARFEFR